MVVWGIAETAGMRAQVSALAQTLGLQCNMKQARLRPWFAWIPNIFFAGPLRRIILSRAVAKPSEFSQVRPDLVISCGRIAAAIALGLKARGARVIHIQDPYVSPKHFDLVIAMAHDKLKGKNVISTRFALHAISADLLQGAAARFNAKFAVYPKPRIAVLLGGSTHRYKLKKPGMQQILAQLQQLLASTTGSLLITPSRRTGKKNIAMLRHTFAGNPRVYIYDLKSDNPYIGLLAVADFLVVTNDSNNMMSEAHATGKPIFILPLPGHDNTKPARFAQGFIEEGIARPIGSPLETWTYPASNEMQMLASEVRFRIKL